MKCAICKRGICEPGTITVTLERGPTTVVIRQVPAMVCNTCGEEYLNEEITDTVLSIAEHDVESGVQVDIREYRAACASI
ncbi:type II toxin-antitoxin system MqsA family antitoxin [Methanospirillum purgamenti]|jgi:YgiT-type zinc finger domain-containing protein|uniref:Type II toxin-antitoxin system MqsA family antitoxin n=1 Tax=Methanospirillum hungatei TaxID=2203 RepID=A0A8F5ZG88_METHU|nr:type II toxin-antitoxin system MqsA family antitoxin [Methanospirillum hungatei]QXO94229.1 type II toxin-antitoxin system MqsA family antitoxin [Methanospirillum hungatei]